MKREIKDAWLTALRSGEIEQTSTFLERNQPADKPQMCCLGVLANICKVPKTPTLSHYEFLFPEFPTGSVTPTGFQGLDKNTIYILWNMNDNGDKSFSEIADWIEANIPAEDE